MEQTIITTPEPKRLKQLQAETGRGEQLCSIALLMEDNKYHKAKEYINHLESHLEPMTEIHKK
jgi:hypothetical protein